MCITFFYVNPLPSSSQFRFILIFNRDEYYYRKTLAAQYWEEDCTIIGGRDLESDAKGTWLALSTKGKIGLLLNIWGINRPDAVTRGTLPSSFVKNDCTGQEFAKCISSSKYNPYNLLLFDIMSEKINATYHTNVKTDMNIPQALVEGFHGYGNTPSCIPLKKVVFGIEQFTSIVTQYGNVNQKDKLLSQLLQLLKNNKRHFPDAELLLKQKIDSENDSQLSRYSSIFVKIPEKNYGTRTHTIILIDTAGNIEFNEWTMETPDCGTKDGKWGHHNIVTSLQKY